MATLTITPASGSITATKTACRVNVTEADQNRADHTEFRYYLLFDNPDGDDGRSYVFGVSQDEKHEFNSYIFPNSGSWSVKLMDAADDSEEATLAVTVS